MGAHGDGSGEVGKAAVGDGDGERDGERVVVVARLEGEEINPQNHHDQQNHGCVHAGGGGTLLLKQSANRKALEWLESSLMVAL